MWARRAPTSFGAITSSKQGGGHARLPKPERGRGSDSRGHAPRRGRVRATTNVYQPLPTPPSSHVLIGAPPPSRSRPPRAYRQHVASNPSRAPCRSSRGLERAVHALLGGDSHADANYLFYAQLAAPPRFFFSRTAGFRTRLAPESRMGCMPRSDVCIARVKGELHTMRASSIGSKIDRSAAAVSLAAAPPAAVPRASLFEAFASSKA